MLKIQMAVRMRSRWFVVVSLVAIGLGMVVGAPQTVAEETATMISSTKWKTSNSCVSGAYTMESVVTWGPIRDDKRQITNVKILQGQKDDDFSSKRVNYTVRVQTQTDEGTWKQVAKYGPKTADGPISFNPMNPQTLGYGGVQVVVTAGVSGDNIAGCTVTYADREPTVSALGTLVVPPPVVAQPPTNAPMNQANWLSGAALTPNSTALVLERKSYGSLDTIKQNGYPQFDIAAVADSAGSDMQTCQADSPTDPLVSMTNMYCFPYISRWRQQGITGSGSSGMVDRSDIVIASQYDHTTNNAARLVVMNTTTNKYVYVTLVRPCNTADGYCQLGTGKNGTGCKEAHAGGLAWYKDTLFVADGNCFIAFNMRDFFQRKDGTFMLPTSYFWHSRFSEKMILSTTALDTTSATPQIVATEYMKANKSGTCGSRLLGRWDLDVSSGDFAFDAGSTTMASADTVLATRAVCEVQGVASYNGLHFMNSSQGKREYMHRFRTLDTNTVADTKFLMPRRVPEGIYIDIKSNQVWSLVELATKDDQVRVFAMSLPTLLQ